jgi:hypothetical protein
MKVPQPSNLKEQFLSHVLEDEGIDPSQFFMMAGKRVRVDCTEESKLERMEKRLRGDCRHVPEAEVIDALNALRSGFECVTVLKTDINSMTTAVSSLPLEKLRELFDALPSTEKGKGKQLKLQDALKIVFPVIVALEQSLLCVKALHNELVAEATVRFGLTYADTSRDGEYAQMSVSAFRKAVEGILDMKKTQQVRDSAQAQMQAQMQAQFDEAVSREARRLAKAEMDRMMQERADAESANHTRDMDLEDM